MTIGRAAALSVPRSGMRDLEIRQEFEQQRLELVVGAVDLVDQQHALAPARAAPAAAAARSGTDRRRCRSRARRPGGWRAAGAGSSIRRARARRRCPRSIAGAPARGRAPRRSPSRPPSCRRPARLRAAAACRAGSPGRSPSPGLRRRDSATLARRAASASGEAAMARLALRRRIWLQACSARRACAFSARRMRSGVIGSVSMRTPTASKIGVGDGRDLRVGAHLARTLGAIGAVGGRPLQHDDLGLGDVARPRHQILVEVGAAMVAVRDNRARSSRRARG